MTDGLVKRLNYITRNYDFAGGIHSTICDAKAHIKALTAQLEDAYARGFCAGQRALKDAGELVTIDSPEIRDRIEALTVERDAIFNVLSERDCEYNRKTNDMIERHAEQVKALTAERDTARAERDGLLRVVTDNHHALQRAEAAEKKLQEMQAHIDHADAYHTAMLVAEAETRMTMAELAAVEPQPDAAQCCMCGKKGLSTEEDGGPECELHDGRWVCSSDCYDVALGIMLKPVAGAAQPDKINWRDDPDAFVEDDEPQIGRDYA
jgi:hypothetical protein